MRICLFLALLPLQPFQDGALDPSHQWGAWRGPLATGEAPHADPPTTWSEEENVRWKVALPGTGQSTPIVWGEKIFLTAAIPFGPELDPVPETSPGAHDNATVRRRHRFVVLAFDRATGKELWRTIVVEALPHEGFHSTGTLASASPVADGERLFAFFGSRGVHALDHDGNVLWSRDLGDMRVKHGHGEGASPALFGDTLVVNWDHEGPSFLVALDAKTGEDRWRVERDEVTSWATPIVVLHDGKPQAVVPGTTALRGYDLATGEVLWQCGGLSKNVVASPVAAGGRVYAGSSYEKQAMLAIELDGAEGDLTKTDKLAWIRRRRTPYVPSPLLTGDALYVLQHYQGNLSRIETATGEEPTGPYRTGLRNLYASPVAAAGRIYLTDLDGTTLVMSAGDASEPLAYNRLDDSFAASTAPVGDALILRGERFLYCIAEP
jgi:outer membrane protein assembly factor BamB